MKKKKLEKEKKSKVVVGDVCGGHWRTHGHVGEVETWKMIADGALRKEEHYHLQKQKQSLIVKMIHVDDSLYPHSFLPSLPWGVKKPELQ